MLNATPAGLPTWSGSCRRAKPPKTGEDGKERTGRPYDAYHKMLTNIGCEGRTVHITRCSS